MNEEEAASLLRAHLEQYRRRSHADLSSHLGNQGCDEVTGPSGARYQIEVDILWDSRPGGDLRVLGGIDDGTFWRFISPLNDSFLMSPDGTTR